MTTRRTSWIFWIMGSFVTTLVLAGGCGDDGGGHETDAGSQDDADVPPPVGTCTLEVGPQIDGEGQQVVFSTRDGSLIGTAEIADGAASRDDCVDDTMLTLTLAPASSGPWTTVTIAGVARDGTARWGFLSAEPVASPTVTANAVNEPTGTDHFEVDVGCFDTSAITPGVASSPIPISGFCLGRNQDDVDVLVTAFDDASPANLLGTSFLADISVADLTTIDMSSAAWSNGVLQHLITVSGYEPSQGSVVTSAQILVDGRPYWTQAGITDADLGSGSGTFFTPSLPDFGEQAVIIARTTPLSGTSASIQRVYRTLPGTLEIDVSTNLPRVTRPVVVRRDPERPELAWSFDGDIATATGILVNASWHDGSGDTHQWTILSPPTLSIQMPALPDALADFRPDEVSAFGTGLTIVFADDWRTYADAAADGTIVGGLAIGLGQITQTVPSGDGRSDVAISTLVGDP